MDYRLIANELREELKCRDAIITDLQARLTEEKRQHAMSKYHEQVMKRDFRRTVSTLRDKINGIYKPIVPSGDEDSGYFCECGTEIDYPFEQHYCTWCGGRFEWTVAPQNDDDWAYDMLKEERAGVC